MQVSAPSTASPPIVASALRFRTPAPVQRVIVKQFKRFGDPRYQRDKIGDEAREGTLEYALTQYLGEEVDLSPILYVRQQFQKLLGNDQQGTEVEPMWYRDP